MVEAFEEIVGLQKYAQTIYGHKLKADDALDAAYQHILDKYDPQSGTIHNYTISIVSKIGIKNNTKEYSSTELLEEVDLEGDQSISSDYYDMSKSQDLDECIRELTPIYIKDYGYFSTGNKKFKQCSCRKILEMYSTETSLKAISYLRSTYDKEIQRYYSTRALECKRHFSKNIEAKRTDYTVNILGSLNGTIIFSRTKGSKLEKNFYAIDINNAVDMILETLYSESSSIKAFLRIESHMTYCTLLGKEVHDRDTLIEEIKKDLIGSILVNNNVKIIRSVTGIPLFTSKNIIKNFYITVFGETLSFPAIRLNTKEENIS